MQQLPSSEFHGTISQSSELERLTRHPDSEELNAESAGLGDRSGEQPFAPAMLFMWHPSSERIVVLKRPMF
jgi:hypothetical protein